MNPPVRPDSDERRHWERRVNDFQVKVERALFDEEGNSRIRGVEEKTAHMERAMFNENRESRIAKLESNTEKLLQYFDRGKFLSWVLGVAWVGIGGVLGAVFQFWWKK